ncbi:Protein MraZ [Sphingomonas haloaromaticamans]|uniref:Protein MraZ n=1 Tax=Edaphosphingomonas haloaromaticamans TaxID=653954 RepID=A0A1S1HJ85_9SPHN|nr:Protein MraZ [Sphingomonas haloaromaticamans]
MRGMVPGSVAVGSWDVEIRDFFHGSALNAVDAKGRVSLPAPFRTVIDRRTHRALMPGEFPSPEKFILLGEHERLPCLQAFDPAYSPELHSFVGERVDARGDGMDRMSAMDFEQMDVFGAYLQANYDDAGRMVLSPMFRAIAEIEGLAFFLGAGATFQIWNPHKFLEHCQDKPRVVRALEFMLKERGAKA